MTGIQSSVAVTEGALDACDEGLFLVLWSQEHPVPIGHWDRLLPFMRTGSTAIVRGADAVPQHDRGGLALDVLTVRTL